MTVAAILPPTCSTPWWWPVPPSSALASGALCSEVVDAAPATCLVSVTLGLFDDDADGLVRQLDQAHRCTRSGERAVVPAL